MKARWHAAATSCDEHLAIGRYGPQRRRPVTPALRVYLRQGTGTASRRREIVFRSRSATPWSVPSLNGNGLLPVLSLTSRAPGIPCISLVKPHLGCSRLIGTWSQVQYLIKSACHSMMCSSQLDNTDLEVSSEAVRVQILKMSEGTDRDGLRWNKWTGSCKPQSQSVKGSRHKHGM